MHRLMLVNGTKDPSPSALRVGFAFRLNSGVGEQRSSYGTRSITALMESAALWKVDATEAALRAEPGLDRFP